MTTAQFITRTLIVLALAALAATVWAISDVLLLAFGSILFAIILHAIADHICAWTGLSKGWGLVAAGLLGIVVLAGTGYLFGQQISTQLEQVIHTLPNSVQTAFNKLGIKNPTDLLGGSSLGSTVTKLFSWGSALIDTGAGILFMIVAGIYIAASPTPYREGFVKLFPPRWQPNIAETLVDIGIALRAWFLAQLAAMVIIGVMMGIGMWLIGLPSPVALGLIAGVTEFVPLIGPVLGAIPALLIAFAQGPWMVAWALLVVAVVQQSENHLIIPLLIREMVSVPPAVGTFSVVAFGTLFGWLGVLFGYPLAVAFDVAIRLLYVREQLGEDVRIVPEEAEPAPSTGRNQE